MKTAYASAIVLALSAVAAGQAFAGIRPASYGEPLEVTAPAASDSGKSREQVRAELAEAQRTGDIVANIGGEKTGEKLNQVFPSQYPSQSAVASKTRDEVKTELSEAQRSGDLVANIGSGHGNVKQNQWFEQLDASF